MPFSGNNVLEVLQRVFHRVREERGLSSDDPAATETLVQEITQLHNSGVTDEEGLLKALAIGYGRPEG